MVVLWVEGRTPRGLAGLCIGSLLCGLLSGCILDNPKFDLDDTTLGTGGGSTTQDPSSSTAAETEATAGSESASGTTTTGEPTTGEPTTGEPTTSTVGTITEGTSTTTGVTSTTGDDTTDSEASTGEMLCDEKDKIDVYLDGDMDTYGGEKLTVCPDEVPDGYIEVGGDCNDGAANINPGVTELCDGIDNNCNGLKDEYSESNPSCDLVNDFIDKNCTLSTHDGHFYYICKAKRYPNLVNGICAGFAVADGATSYHVKIDDEGENQAVADFATELGADVSIGLYDTLGLNQSKDHKWLEGNVPLTYGQTFGQPPWGPGQPDKLVERWAQMSKDSGLWADIAVNEYRSFVCEAEPKPLP